jgi:hypothetical protein
VRTLLLALAAAIMLAGLAIGWNVARVVWSGALVVYSAPAADPGPAGAPGFICPPGTVGEDGMCSPYSDASST